MNGVTSVDAGGNPGHNIGIGNPAFLQLQAAALSDQGTTFTKWTFGTTTLTTSTICVSAPSGTYTATYSTAVPAPTLTSVSPTGGDLGTTANLTLTGTNFAKDATVSFGGSGITLNSTTVSSATQITANITISGNASALGGHNASVTNPVPAGFTGGGTVTLANGFTVNRRATSTAVNCTPASVSVGTLTTCTATVTDTDSGTTSTPTGGVSFTSSGSGTFSSSGSCSLSGTGATATCNLTYTPTSAGTGTHTITGSYAGDTTHGNTIGAFALTVNNPVPTLTNISPTSGPTVGGTSVAITGTNFTGATAVKFGATSATTFTVNSATSITATAPAGTAGTVDITVTTAGGTSAISEADKYIYVAAPTVTSLSPTSGPTAGGTSVTITGTNFAGATAVKFGATSATTFTVNTATSVTATAPAGTAGTVDVTVTTTGGTSATSAGDQYTYQAATSLTISAPTVTFPANGVVTVTVSSTAGTPTGNATLSVDGGAALTQPLNGSGVATFTLTSPSVGSHNLSASYAAQGNFAASGPTTGTLSVNAAATTTSISAPTTSFGTNGMVTVTVAAADPTAGTPTGNVSLTVDAGSAVSQALMNGSTTFTVSNLNAGDHALSASYAAQNNFNGSSATSNLHVNQAQATLSFDNLTFTYDGSPKPVSVTTAPANLAGVTILYNGSATPPTNPGSTPVSASLTNANYTAAPINGTELVLQASTITSDATTTFTAGTTGTFNVTTMGFPTASLMETGPLPGGVSFTDNLNGTATLAGTATVAGSYPITIAASNGVGSPAMQAFTLVVTAGDFTKLQLLVPGETAAPGTASGKTGTPNTEYVNGAFNIIVNAVDTNWNVVSSVTDTVNIASTDTDPNVKLPANAALVAGTGTLSVTLQTVSYNPAITTLTASDMTDSSKTESSPVIEVIVVYTAGIAPSMVATGDSVAYTLMVNNAAAPNTNTLRSVTVAIPAEGGTPGLVSVTAANAGPIPANWTADLSQISSHQLRFTQNAATDGVGPGGTISIQFTATASNTVSGSLAQNVWTTTAFSDAAYTSALPLAGMEPTVGIGARPVITSADHTTNEFAYGAAGTFTVITTGFPIPSLSESGSLPGGVTFTDKGDGTATLAGTPTAAGTFTLTITAHNGYGSDATQTFTLTVNKATATPSITADDKNYDGTTAATIHCTLSGVLSADTANVTCSGTGNFVDANAGMGKTVTSSNLALGGSASGNYMLSTTTATTSAKINAKPVTATITASNKNYDGNNTATITSCTIPGKVGSDDVACSVPAGNATFASSNASPTAQMVTATGITLSGNTASNYTLGMNTTATTMATINPTPLTITANDKSKTYGGTDPVFDASFSGFVNSENASVLAGTAVFNFAGKPPTSYGPSTTVPTNAGTYAVRPSGLTSTNYAITFKGGSYTINQATPTVTVTDPMPTYDGSPHMATATAVGFDGHTAVSGSFNLTYDGSTTAPTYAKTSYMVVASFTSSDPNYTNATGNGTLTIKQAGSITMLTFELGPYTYQGTAFTATAVATGAGGLNAAVTPVLYSGDCTNVTITNGCTATATYAGDTNHTGSMDSKSITITQAGSTTTVNCPATVIYNGMAQAPCTASVTGAGGLNQSLTANYSNNINVGTASAFATFAGDVNHTGSSDSKTFTISPRPITVTADLQGKVFGEMDPPLTYKITSGSLASGDGFMGGLVRLAGENVGTYLISVGTLTAGLNYNLTFVGATLTITPANTSTIVASSPGPLGLVPGCYIDCDSGEHPHERSAYGLSEFL